MRDLLEYIERTDESAILLNLDQEKAFDRVNSSFLLSLIIAFGFGSVFCRWISTCYEGAFMQIIVIIIHQTHYEKSDSSRAFNQFTIACELDMINVISASDILFIMSS